ncbi:TMIE [Mytilus edulis]|uniref:TMIE n=1 Tax=Mytilus edulis TaxID=6550 RepID=A0A8S3PN91_MYTED|nr:TMIE [Mytilus edulis]
MELYLALSVLTLQNSIRASRLVYKNGSSYVEDNDATSSSINIENYIIGPFKIWHVGGMVISFIMTIVIIFCCCKDVRIPRTKQEIEARYKQKQICSKLEGPFFSLSRDGYKTYIEHVTTQKMDEKRNKNSNINLPKAKIKGVENKIGDTSKENLLSKWKGVSKSLKTISEDIQSDEYMTSGLKPSNIGLRGQLQRPSQGNVLRVLNSVTSARNINDCPTVGGIED